MHFIKVFISKFFVQQIVKQKKTHKDQGFSLFLNKGFSLFLNKGFSLFLNKGFSLFLNKGPKTKDHGQGVHKALLKNNKSLFFLTKKR